MRVDSEILSLFGALSLSDQEMILDKLMQEHELLSPSIEKAKAEAEIIEDKKPCPHCKSKAVHKRGHQKGMRMYSCKDCKKWYSQSTGTPLWDIKLKSKWSKYVRCVSEGYSLRKSAKEVGICLQTSFDWRHKILSSLSSLIPESLSGTIECDEMELAINNKGDRNLNRKARKRSTDFSRNES